MNAVVSIEWNFVLFVLVFLHWSIFRLDLLILPKSLFWLLGKAKIMDVYNDKDKAIDYCCDTIQWRKIKTKSINSTQ